VVSKELTEYITGERAAGRSDSDIRTSLESAGWQTDDINVALGQKIGDTQPALPSKDGADFSNKKYRKLGLALIVVGFVALLGGGVWAYVTYFNPDPHTVLSRMVTEVQEVSSFAFTSSASFYGPEPDYNATSTEALSFWRQATNRTSTRRHWNGGES